MYEQKVIERKLFALCLGKDGGYFQIGGYDEESHLEDEVSWIKMLDKPSFEINIQGISINNHPITKASNNIKTAFIDSGTTFTYFPQSLISQLKTHLDWFCAVDPENNCKGERVETGKQSKICFSYDQALFSEGPKEYFLSFPIISIKVESHQDKGKGKNSTSLDWYPSEYFYRTALD